MTGMPHIDLPKKDIPLNVPIRVEHAGTALVVVRTEAGVFAYKDVCPHAFWPLSSGAMSGGALECPGHGWEFDVQTGRCLNAPTYCLSAATVVQGSDTVRLTWQSEEKDASQVAPCLDRRIPNRPVTAVAPESVNS